MSGDITPAWTEPWDHEPVSDERLVRLDPESERLSYDLAEVIAEEIGVRVALG